jgi:hypothetical protein
MLWARMPRGRKYIPALTGIEEKVDCPRMNLMRVAFWGPIGGQFLIGPECSNLSQASLQDLDILPIRNIFILMSPRQLRTSCSPFSPFLVVIEDLLTTPPGIRLFTSSFSSRVVLRRSLSTFLPLPKSSSL